MSRNVNKKIYDLTRQEQFSRDYALCNQIRRASISILSNIAEGFERNGDKEFIQFLSIAKGSCGEVYAQLYIALDQNYMDEKMFNDISLDLEGIGRTIGGLMKYLKQSELKGSKFK